MLGKGNVRLRWVYLEVVGWAKRSVPIISGYVGKRSSICVAWRSESMSDKYVDVRLRRVVLNAGFAPRTSSFSLLAQRKGTKRKGTRMAPLILRFSPRTEGDRRAVLGPPSPRAIPRAPLRAIPVRGSDARGRHTGEILKTFFCTAPRKVGRDKAAAVPGTCPLSFAGNASLIPAYIWARYSHVSGTN
jgi:hypothetical protein